MNTDKICINRINGSNSYFIPTTNPSGGVKQRIGWNVLEQLLRNSNYLKPEEYIQACEIDFTGVEITIENKND